MHEQQHEHSPDEPEIEIIDLNALPGASNNGKKDHTTGTTTSVPARLSLRSRLTTRQRGTRLLVTTLLLVFALLIVLANSPAAHVPALAFLFHSTPISTPSPAPTATSNPNINQFFIQGIPPWGQLYLDERVVQVVSNEMPLLVGRGHHLFLVLAPPFQPLSCTVSVPIEPTDTCHYTRADMQVSNTWMLTFHESLATLPIAQRQALIQATQTTLNEQQSTTLVQLGEQYLFLGTPGLVNIATQPLHATLHFHLLVPALIDSSCLWVDETTNPACATQIRECLLFCTVPYMATLPGATTSWLVQVAFRASFDYANTRNTIVAANQPDMKPDPTASPALVTLGITWDGSHWHVRIIGPAIPAGNPLACVSAENNITQNLFQQAESTFSGFSLQFVASSTPADGCLLALLLLPNTNGTASTSSAFATSPNAYFLYRFGLYLAVNDMAHLLWPQIPMADSYERGLAQKMAAPLFAP